MKVLIAGEYSGRVRDAFRAQGHDAMSCDYRPSEAPGPHYQGSWFDVDLLKQGWDLLIAHPDCTFLTVSGNRWAAQGWRIEARQAALYTVRALWALPIAKKAIENPIGVLSTLWRRPDQVIEPFHFGDPYRKATCLWLDGLPCLQPTNNLGTGVQACWKAPPSPERKRNRSRTYPGIALAMAAQWGSSAALQPALEEWALSP